ncbi:unnamed protein product [Cunninghamella blakesleeana]
MSTTMSNDNHNTNNNNMNNKEEATKKRTRATAEQLAILEDTFAVNVSPNSKLRKQLADQLKMTDRSIQIWFQNRRAKVKHLQKKAQLQMHQAHMRAQLYHYQQQHYYLQQHFAPHQRAHSMDSYYHQNNHHSIQRQPSYHSNHLLDDRQSSMPPPNLLLPFHLSNPTSDLTSDHADSYITTTTINTSSSSPSSSSSSLSPSLQQTRPLELTSKDISIHVSSLTIGKWHRMKMQENDLTCVYQPEKQSLCWFIIDGEHQFKIEIMTSTIQQFIYYHHSTSSNQVLGEIQLDLTSSPVFYMKQQQEWTSCSDFTEHQQASQILKHSLKGMNVNLWQDLTHLIATYPETQQWIQMVPSPHPSLLSSSLSTSSNEDDDIHPTTNHLLLTSSSIHPITTSSLSYNNNTNHNNDSLNAIPLSTTAATMTLPSSLDINDMESSLYYLTKNNHMTTTSNTNGINELEPFISNDDYLTTDPSLLDPSLWPTTLNY